MDINYWGRMMSDTKGISDIPNEMIAEVAKHLYSGDPNQALRDVENFRLVNRRFNAAIADMPGTRRSNDQLHRLGRMALSVYNAVIPGKTHLPDQNAEQPESAYAHVAVASWLLKFRPPSERTQLVDKVLDVSDFYGVRTEASIPLMDSKHIEPKDRNKLIQNAITSLERNREATQPLQNELLKQPARHVLIQAREGEYLSNEQMKQLPAEIHDAPKPDIDGISNEPLSGKAKAFKEHMESNIKPVKNYDDLDRNIDLIEKKITELLTELSFADERDVTDDVIVEDGIDADALGATNKRHKILECLENVAKHISDAYGDSRHLLLANDRQISPSSVRPTLDERPRSGRAD